MGLWKYGLLVFLGGCSYGMVSTFVKLAYGLGFGVSDVTGTQYFFWSTHALDGYFIFTKKESINL